MKIQPELNPVSFSETARGSPLLAIIKEREIVQGVKAFHVNDGGAETEFLVTIGPFVEEHGARPIVYTLDEVGTDLVVDTSERTRLAYSLRPESLVVKNPETAAAKPAAGELIFSEGKRLLTVANFGRAGPADIAYLDLESGELSGLPDAPRYISLSEWRIEMRNDDGGMIYEQDFAVSE